MCTPTNLCRIPPLPPEKFSAAASRILIGAPAHQPDLVRTSRKTDSGAADGSTLFNCQFLGQLILRDD